MGSLPCGARLFVVVLLAGCGRDQPLGPWTTREDSAGIDIVTISMPDKRDAEFRSSDVILRLDIGMAEGPDHAVLTGVVGAARMSDGRIVVADGGSNELRFFELDGEFAGRVGGDGEGPGEFRSIAFLAVTDNDSIVAYDNRLRRLSVFAPSGTFVRLQLLTGVTLPSIAGMTGTHALAAGQFVGADDERLGIYAVPMEVGLIDARTGSFKVIDTLPGSEESRVQYRGRVTRAFRPFGHEADIAAGGHATYVLTSSDDASIRQHDLDGRLTRIIRLDISRTSADAEAVQSWTASWLDRFSPGAPEIEEWWQHGFQETPPPEHVPLIRFLEVDTDGNVCAERYPMTWTSSTEYWCFTPDGRFVRAILLPEGLMRSGPHPHQDAQLEIGADYVLGVWQDSLDVQHVRLYDIKSQQRSERGRR